MSTVKNVWGEKRRERKPKADEFLGEEGGDELLSAALERMASIIQDEKMRCESSFQTINQEITVKHKQLENVHQEYLWLRRECDKLKAQSRTLTGEQERQTQNIDNLIQLIIGEDLDEVAVCIPRVYGQYTQLRTVSGTEQLLADITQTRKMLDKFEFLTKSTQSRFKRGEVSTRSMKRLTSEEAMKLYLIKLRKDLEVKIANSVHERLNTAHRQSIAAANKEPGSDTTALEEENPQSSDVNVTGGGLHGIDLHPTGNRYRDALMRTILASPMNRLSESENDIQIEDENDAEPDPDFTLYNEAQAFL